MIVPDASAVVELLINGRLASSIQHDLAMSNTSWVVPHLLDIEVVSALRKLTAGRRVDPHLTSHLMHELAMLPAQRCAHEPLLPRIWELRHNFTCYDAAYIALAEALNATLYTCDAKLTKGHRAEVRLFE